MTITKFIEHVHTDNNSHSTSGEIAKPDQEHQEHVKHSYSLRGGNGFFSRYPTLRRGESLTGNKLFTVNPFIHPKRKKMSGYFDGTLCEFNIEPDKQEIADSLVMLGSSGFARMSSNNVCMDKDTDIGRNSFFQCKGCKKNFNSHQALGGHRASHKKVKGCFASSFDTITNTEDNDDDTMNANYINPAVSEDETYEFLSSPFSHSLDLSPKSKVHACSVCQRKFSSGQALGGHKRCHWLNSSYDSHSSHSQDNTICQSIPNFLFHTNLSLPTFEMPSMVFNYNESTSKPNNIETITKKLYEEKQDDDYYEEKDNYDEKCDYKNINNSPPPPTRVVGNYYGINDIKMEGVCSSWLQIGISSDPTNHDHGISGDIG